MPKKTQQKKPNTFLLPMLIAALGVLIIVMVMGKKTSPPDSTVTPPNIDVPGALTSATLIIPGTSNSVALTEPYFLVKNADGNDLFATMVYNTGGSGTFVALALFQDMNDTPVMKGSFPIGDRVVVKSIKQLQLAQNGAYTLSITYLDRKAGEPMATTPTMEKVVEVSVKDHMFVK